MESAIIPEAFETRCLWVRKLMRRGRGVEGREGAQERAENAAKEEYRGGGRMMSLSSRASPPYERVGQNNSPLPLLPSPSSLSALARRFFLPPCPPPLIPLRLKASACHCRVPCQLRGAWLAELTSWPSSPAGTAVIRRNNGHKHKTRVRKSFYFLKSETKLPQNHQFCE